jgi:hypothetical protein
VQCGEISRAESLFDGSAKRAASSYGAMMRGYFRLHTHNIPHDLSSLVGYVVNGMPDKAIALFSQVRNPDEIVITILFNACALVRTAETLDLVKKVASEVPKSSYSDVILVASLLDALMKCGDVAAAGSLFDSTKNKVMPMYGAMMKGDCPSRILNTRVVSFLSQVTSRMACRTKPLIFSDKFQTPMQLLSPFYSMLARSWRLMKHWIW